MQNLRSIRLIEVGLRDGLQSESTVLSTIQKANILKQLVNAGIKSLQVTSFVHPQKVPSLADAEEICLQLPKSSELTFSGLALNLKGVQRAVATRLDCIDMGVSCSDTHSLKNVGKKTSEALNELGKMIELAKANGKQVRAGIQCAFDCNFEGKTPQAKALEICEMLVRKNISMLSIADSTGKANPESIREFIRSVRKFSKDTPIVMHLHDTWGRAISNMYAAYLEGVDHFDVSFGGLGGCPFIPGAKGNIATEDAIDFFGELGHKLDIKIDTLAKLSIETEETLGYTLPSRYLQHYKRSLKNDG